MLSCESQLSICQKDPKLFDRTETPEGKPEAERATFQAELKDKTKVYGGAAYEASRSRKEKASFDFALHHTMDLWYVHQGTTVFMLTKLPEGSGRKAGYADSGWTTYERSSAEQIKKAWRSVAKWDILLDLGAAVGEQGRTRAWPIGPDDFDIMIENKLFTNGADCDHVKRLYRKMSIKQLGGVRELDFVNMRDPSVEEAQRLGRCLNLCTNLESVTFHDGVNMECLGMLYRAALKGNPSVKVGMIGGSPEH